MTSTIQRFSEAVSSDNLIVDEDNGIIRNVKIIGTSSKNKRRYLPEALIKAIPLYDKKGVFINHKKRRDAEEDRSFNDKAAWLENVRPDKTDGLIGDVHYLKTDPNGLKLAEIAKRNPGMCGLSHDAEGSVKTVNGETIVEEIRKVYSVDVVTDPATTKSLRESTERLRLQEVEIRDESQLLAALVESGYGDMTPEMESDEADPVTAAFKSVLLSVLDGDGDITDKLKKIKLILSTQEKLMADANKPAEKPAADPAMQESLKTLQAENAALKEANEAVKAELAKLTEAVTKITEAKSETIVSLPEAKRGEGTGERLSAFDAELAKRKAK